MPDPIITREPIMTETLEDALSAAYRRGYKEGAQDNACSEHGYDADLNGMTDGLSQFLQDHPATIRETDVRIGELPTMFGAFRTTTSHADGRMTMEFRFSSIEEMQRADEEWHTFRATREPASAANPEHAGYAAALPHIRAALKAYRAELGALAEGELRQAAQNLLDRMFSTMSNGKTVEADDDEMCWIVHSDEIESLRAALRAIASQHPHREDGA
jgi:hypothetical protein